jgi:hypothetical protein
LLGAFTLCRQVLLCLQFKPDKGIGLILAIYQPTQCLETEADLHQFVAKSDTELSHRRFHIIRHLLQGWLDAECTDYHLF